MPKSKKKVAVDKSKVSEHKSKALEVVEDDMSKSKDEPTQPATTSTVEEETSGC